MKKMLLIATLMNAAVYAMNTNSPLLNYPRGSHFAAVRIQSVNKQKMRDVMNGLLAKIGEGTSLTLAEQKEMVQAYDVINQLPVN